MNFQSAEYGTLLLVSLGLYWALPWQRARLLVILAASYAFYMSWSEKLVVLLLFSTVLDYFCGQRIFATQEDRSRRRWLYVSLAGNLGILGLFKYYGFFIDSFIVLLHSMGVDAHERTLHFILPLGISFYTFQTLSYTIDIYRGQLRPTDSVIEFAAFVAFFPQLVAGPIVRARDFLPQLVSRRRFAWTEFQWGLERIVIGLVKKAVIADNLAQVVNHHFATAAGATSTHAWIAVLAFYGQVYCDFSGYSDIAIGSARLFGFRIKENFSKPYLTTSPQQYWNHWHISLSTWLRDYVYFPLGGNRHGTVRTYINLFLTMFVSGVWHGAAWTFVIWGMYHGACLAVHRVWSRAGYKLPFVAGLFGQILFTSVGYFMFRAESWQNMVDMLRAACGGPIVPLSMEEVGAVVLCAAVFGLEPLGTVIRQTCVRTRYGPLLRGALLAFGINLIMFAKRETALDFVYFVF